MIIYVASYPRSGNSWILNLIGHHFGIYGSNYYFESGSPDNLRQADNQVLGEVLVLYNSPREGKPARRLADNCGLVLNTDLRKKLSAEDECFVIKTHEPPYREYFDNEIVLHLVRHPAATAWSYLNLKRAEDSATKISLEEVIFGDAFVGSWSSHTNGWLKFAEVYPQKYLQIRYELLGLQTEKALKQIEEITGVSRIDTPAPFPDFAYWNSIFPTMYRSGKKDEWAGILTDQQVALAWLVNGNLMKSLNYDFSAYQAGLTSSRMADFCLPFYEEIMSHIGKHLQKRDKAIADLAKQLEAKDNYMGELGQQIKEKNKNLLELIQEIKNKDQAITYLGSQVTEAEAKKLSKTGGVSDLLPLTEKKRESQTSSGLPTISIVVPSLNHGAFLRQNLESIFLQEYEAIEVVVMDGGSTDNSVEIIKEFADRLKHWQSASDEGQADAINKGMQYCSGDIVTWLNADDWYLEDALWIVARAYLQNPNHGLFIGNGFRERDGSLERFCPRHIAISKPILREGLDYILQPATFISREAWLHSGGLDTELHFGLDWDLFIRILEDYPAVAINEFLAVSREYEATKTASGKMHRSLELIRVAQKHNDTEMTLGSSFYLMETMLQLNQGEFPEGSKSGAYQAIGQIKEEMRKTWGTSDSFPLTNDPENTSYIQFPDSSLPSKLIPASETLPTISIVIPSYNQARYLPRALESIINQNYPKLEILVLDGGSTDGSVEIIDRYANKLSYWQSQKDKGPAEAINLGFKRSTGEIVGWLSSDDMLAEGALWKLAKEFTESPFTDVIYGNALYIDEDDALFNVDHGHQKTAFYYGKLQEALEVPYYWTYLHAIPQPTVYFRRSLLQRVGSLDTSFHYIFDFEFFWRLRKIAEFKKIDKTLAFYRIHVQSKTSSWENFLVELYRFSRPLWPKVGTQEYRRVLAQFFQYYFSSRFGRYRRLYFPLKLTLVFSITLRLLNPERLANWVLKKRTAESYFPPKINSKVRTDISYLVSPNKKTYTISFCGFFFPLHPGKSGGEIRDFHILRKLSSIAEVDFMALATNNTEDRLDFLGQHMRSLHDPERLRSFLPELVDQEAFKIGFRTRVLRWLRNRKIPVIGPRYHVDASSNIYLNSAYVLRALNHMMRVEKPDFLFITPQLNPLPIQITFVAENCRTILSSYDLEKIRMQRIAAAQPNLLARKAMEMESKRAESFERDSLGFYDGIIAVSELDKGSYISEYGFESERIVVIDNSVDTEYFSFRPRVKTEQPEVVFTGSLAYFPNEEAAKRLVQQIMPLVWRKSPRARVWIVGQNPGQNLRKLADGNKVFVTGTVADVRPYIDMATLTCIPLRTGSGTKYKVLEAASLGVPIVCTPLALEGLSLEAERHVLLGESDSELAEAILRVIKNPQSFEKASVAAAHHVQQHYSWDANLSKLDEWLEKIKDLPKRGRLLN